MSEPTMAELEKRGREILGAVATTSTNVRTFKRKSPPDSKLAQKAFKAAKESATKHPLVFVVPDTLCCPFCASNRCTALHGTKCHTVESEHCILNSHNEVVVRREGR